MNSDFIFNDNKYSIKEIKLPLSKENNENIIAITNSQLENAVIRTRLSQDKFTYPKRKITKPLRKVMNEMRIPQEIRDKLLLIALENQILWCEHIGKSDIESNEEESVKWISIEIIGGNYA